jgi:C_GCAxxG_C_C family probable redox protein
LRTDDEGRTASASEALPGLIRSRAENLFKTHQLLCAEAVLYVLNQGLGGGLPPEAAIRIASGFSEGVSGAGCMCGAFSGALMAVGLFLGRKPRAESKRLYDQFRSRFGSPCCRVLTRKFKDSERALFRHCTGHTGEVAEMAARFILEARPELVGQADWDFLRTRDSKLKAGLNRLLTAVKP